MTVRPVRDAAEFSSDGLSTLLHYQLLKQRLGLEIARLQDEQHPTCQAVVAIGHCAFFRGEGEIVDALIVREPGTAVELFDLGVFENCDAVLVSSGHGGSLFLRGLGTHLFVYRAEADPEATRHVLGLPPTRLGARATFNPASVRLRMTLCSNSAFSSSPQNAEMRRPRLCGVVNGIRAELSTSAENQTDPLPGF